MSTPRHPENRYAEAAFALGFEADAEAIRAEAEEDAEQDAAQTEENP